jgi:hypothetical protein
MKKVAVPGTSAGRGTGAGAGGGAGARGAGRSSAPMLRRRRGARSLRRRRTSPLLRALPVPTALCSTRPAVPERGVDVGDRRGEQP